MKYELQTQSKFIFVSFLIVIILGKKTFDSLFLDFGQGNQEHQLSENVLRNPASVSPAQLTTPVSKPLKNSQLLQEAITISLNCQKNKKIATKSTMIMLRGQHCFKDLKGDEVKMTNLKNGFEASFFALEKNQFNTDLIQLSDGTNEIEIQVIKNQVVVYSEKIQIDAQLQNPKQ